MITKAQAKKLIHRMVVQSLHDHPAEKLFKGSYSKSDYKKLQKEMDALKEFLTKRGKLNEDDQTDASGESGSEEAEVSAVRKS